MWYYITRFQIKRYESIIFRNGKRKESIIECFENGKLEKRKRSKKKELDNEFYRRNHEHKIVEVQQRRRETRNTEMKKG